MRPMHTYRITQRSGAKSPPKLNSVGDITEAKGDDPRRGKDVFFFDDEYAYISFVPSSHWDIASEFFGNAQKLMEANKTSVKVALKDITFLARIIVGLKKDRVNLATLLAYYADSRAEAIHMVEMLLDNPTDKRVQSEVARWYKGITNEKPPLG